MLHRTTRNFVKQVTVGWLTFWMAFGSPMAALAGTPSGGTFVEGTGSIVSGANSTTVTVNQANSIINWSSLDTAPNELLKFLQSSGSNSAVLNKIMSANPTMFNGILSAKNMRIFVVNPAGIVFGSGAKINANQFVASGLNIANEDFLSGNYKFQGGKGTVINKGEIYADKVALIGQQVINSGLIQSDKGYVVLAAGEKVFLSEEGSDIVVEVGKVATDNPAAIGTGIDNQVTGKIKANEGIIILAAAGDLYSQAILSVGSLDVSSEVANAGSVKIQAEGGVAVISGGIDASSSAGTGGNIDIKAASITVGNLTTATANNVYANADVGNIALTAQKDITVNGDIVASQKLDILGGQSAGAAQITINADVTAGSMRIKNGKDTYDGEQSYSAVTLAEGKTLTSTVGDVVVEAVHDITLGGDVTAVGGIYLNADEDGYGDPGGNDYTGKQTGGGDLVTQKLTADGNIYLLGNDIKLNGAVKSGDNLTITGRTSEDADTGEFGNVYAASTLEAAGNIDISVTGETKSPVGHWERVRAKVRYNEDGWWNNGWGYKDVWVNTGSYVESYNPGTINLGGNVTAQTGNLTLRNSTNVAPYSTLKAGNNIVLADYSAALTGEEKMTLIAGNEIVAPETVISVTGSELVMQQGVSLDTKNYMFANQANTDLTLISDDGSVTSTRTDYDGGLDENAANVWASIAASAKDDITLTGKGGTITLGEVGSTGNSLYSENGSITVENGVGSIHANGDQFDGVAASIIGQKNIVADNGSVSVIANHKLQLNGELVKSDTSMTLKSDTDYFGGDNLIVNGNVEAGTSLDVDGRNVTLNGNVTAGGDTTILAHGARNGSLRNSNYAAEGDVTIAGTVVVADGGKLNVTAQRDIDLASSVQSDGDMTLVADAVDDEVGSVYARNTLTSVDGSVDIAASDNTIHLFGDVEGNGDIILRNNTEVAGGVTLTAGDDVVLAGGKDIEGLGALNVLAGDDILIGVDDVDTHESTAGLGSAGDVTVAGDLMMKADSDIYVYGDIETTAGGDVTLLANMQKDKAVDTVKTKSIVAGGSVIIEGEGIDVDGDITADDAVMLTVIDDMKKGGVINLASVAGYIDAQNEVVIDVEDNLKVDGSITSEKSFISVLANTDNLKTGGIEIGGDVVTSSRRDGDINIEIQPNTKNSNGATGDIVLKGKVDSARNLTIVAQQGDVKAKDSLESRYTMNLKSVDGSVTVDGLVDAGTTLDISAGTDVALNDTVDSGREMTMDAGNNITLQKAVTAGNDMTLVADADNEGTGDMIAMAELESRRGSIEISSSDNTTYLHADVTADDNITLNNNTWAADDVTLKAGDDVTTYGTLTGAGDLTIEAGDNIMLGDDAGDYVLVDGTLVAKSGLDSNIWYYLFPDGSKGSININADTEAGNIVLSAGHGMPGYSNSHVTVADGAKLTANRKTEGPWYRKRVITEGNITIEAHHGVTLSGAVDADGDIMINADRHGDYRTPDHMKGGDVVAEKAITAGGTVDIYGNDIKLLGNVTSNKDMTIVGNTSADFKTDETGEVYVEGNLKSKYGNIDIDARGNTIHLQNEYVKAGDNVTLRSNTTTKHGVLIKAGDDVTTYGTLTGNGSLAIEAGDNIMLGDDVLVDGTLVANSGVYYGKGSIEAAGNVTAGTMHLRAGQLGFSDSHVSITGDVTTTAGDMTIEAHHDVTLAGNVESAANLTLNADRHKGIFIPDHMMGGDIVATGTVEAAGTIDMLGNNILLAKKVEAGGDMTIRANTSPDFKDALPEGDVVAAADLVSTGGSIEIFSSDNTTHLSGNVIAENNVTLHNTTEADGGMEQVIVAKTGTLTVEKNLTKTDAGTLVLKAGVDVALNGEAVTGSDTLIIEAVTGEITSPATISLADGGRLILKQNSEMDLQNFNFANQDSTHLMANATGGSFTATDASGDNAADKWASIQAKAQDNIVLQGSTGDIVIGTDKGTSAIAAGNVDAMEFGGVLESTQGGVSVIADAGTIRTYGDTKLDNVRIEGYSDTTFGNDIGVQLPDGPGKAAIILIAKNADKLDLGPGVTLIANGTYKAGETQGEVSSYVDDRAGVSFLDSPAGQESWQDDPGVPIDVAIYIANYDSVTNTGGSVDVGATVKIGNEEFSNGTMVIDAYDVVTFDGKDNKTGIASYLGGNFIASLQKGLGGPKGAAGETNRLEIVSRVTESLDQALEEGTLPYVMGNEYNARSQEWFGNDESFLLRGGEEAAWVLEWLPENLVQIRSLGLLARDSMTGNCAELVAWAASELGIDSIELNADTLVASSDTAEAELCEICSNLNDAAIAMQDVDGAKMAAMLAVFNELAPASQPFDETVAASIQTSFADNVDNGTNYAMAAQYLDALAQYITIVDTQIDTGFEAGQALGVAMEKYGQEILNSENPNLAAFVTANVLGTL